MVMRQQATEGHTGMHSRRMKRVSQRHRARGRRTLAKNKQERQKTGRDTPQGGKRRRAEKTAGDLVTGTGTQQVEEEGGKT
jgi:hypothetical protein